MPCDYKSSSSAHKCSSHRFIGHKKTIEMQIKQNLHPHLFPCNVTACSTEALGERAHHDIHVAGVQPEVIDHSSPLWTQGPDAVGLVEVKVCPVTLLQCNHFRQTHYTALHAVCWGKKKSGTEGKCQANNLMGFRSFLSWQHDYESAEQFSRLTCEKRRHFWIPLTCSFLYFKANEENWL